MINATSRLLRVGRVHRRGPMLASSVQPGKNERQRVGLAGRGRYRP